MLSTQTAAALAARELARATPPAPRMAAVRVLRAFCLAGQRQEIGAELELPAPLAAELRSAGKVEPITTPPEAAPADKAVRAPKAHANKES